MIYMGKLFLCSLSLCWTSHINTCINLNFVSRRQGNSRDEDIRKKYDGSQEGSPPNRLFFDKQAKVLDAKSW